MPSANLVRSSMRSGARPTAGTAMRRPLSTAQPRVVCRATNNVPSDAVDFEELSEIVKLVNSTDIVDMEWKGKRFNISLKKKEALKAAEPQYQVVSAPAQMMAAAPAAAPAAAAPAPAPAAAAPSPAPVPKPAAAPSAAQNGIELRSPMSGTFYASAAPGEPVFVKVGDRVKKGQTVGIIEAMKLMNEIEAEVSGEVVKLVAENGKPINAGQPIMIIKS
mmetsp:Transcript_33336/g.99279  ORF Transcript_33336/g.99279 Transcript_33336/m.99279 type:complete len:219 (-) Transcript_33336:265-921(-)